MANVSLITFGCAKNLVDSEVMAGYLGRAGYAFINDPVKADIIVLNTCGFIGPAKEEAEAGIERALRIKKRGRQRVVVAGCYVERNEAELRKLYPEVDAWVGVKDFDKIVRIAAGIPFQAAERTFLYDHTMPRVLTTPASWAYVKISEGCSHRCAFCSIPSIKGPYRSRPMSSIVEEVRNLARAGVREVDLISQDTTYFGRDKGRSDGLALLLKRIIAIPGTAWVRFLYGYPEEITDGLLEILSEPKVCPYLDIPFQHSDGRILRAMRRATDGRKALKLLARIRKRIPDIAVRTSLVVGFPGEGVREFENLKTFVREARFNHLGIFTYSQEEGTPAERLGDPVPERVKEHRRDVLLEIQAGMSKDKMRSYVGRTLDVLIEGPRSDGSGILTGRTRYQAPEVDGLVFIRMPAGQTLDGVLHKVEITGSGRYDLRGTIVS